MAKRKYFERFYLVIIAIGCWCLIGIGIVGLHAFFSNTETPITFEKPTISLMECDLVTGQCEMTVSFSREEHMNPGRELLSTSCTGKEVITKLITQDLGGGMLIKIIATCALSDLLTEEDYL